MGPLLHLQQLLNHQGAPMDALELLREDHERINRLIEQCQSSGPGNEWKTYFSKLKSELDLHLHAEETVFYPAFNRYDDIKSLIDESFSEHQTVKGLLTEIQE